MSMHLLPAPPGGATKLADRALSLLVSYENGGVKLWRYHNVEKEQSIEGVGWECVWSLKLHVESGKPRLLLSIHSRRPIDFGTFTQPLRQSWQRLFHLTAPLPCRCLQTTWLEDTT